MGSSVNSLRSIPLAAIFSIATAGSTRTSACAAAILNSFGYTQRQTCRASRICWSSALEAEARNRPRASTAFTRVKLGVSSFCTSSISLRMQPCCPLMPISSMARGRISTSSESYSATSNFARCSADAVDSCRIVRSCAERGHCDSRAGRIFSTFSGESWLNKPMASTASPAGAVCNVSTSRWTASSPRFRTIELSRSQSSRNPQCPKRLVT